MLIENPPIGPCPECWMNGRGRTPEEARAKSRVLVDGIRCLHCYKCGQRAGTIPRPPQKVRVKQPPKPRPKSPGFLQRRAEEEALAQALESIEKGTHFLSLAASKLGWPLNKTRLVYGRLYDRGHRRSVSGNLAVLALLEAGPRTLSELKEMSGLCDESIYAALRELGPRLTVSRMGRKRLYRLD